MTKGRFGIHGGQYIPETLMNAVLELERAYEYYKNDKAFWEELRQLYRDYANRPSMLYYAEKMTKDLGGAKIYLKREDLNHTGAHKINNVLGQCLLAQRMGKKHVRPARGGHGDGGGADGHGMHCVHGQGRLRTAGPECIPHGTAGGEGGARHHRHRHPEGCGERSAPGMDGPGGGHLLRVSSRRSSGKK